MPMREIKFPAPVLRRAKPIKVLLMDVDGTMTPGYVCLQTFPDGSVAEMKMFHAHDGAGIKLASIMGIRTGLITGRDSPATARRARESSMEFVIQGQPKKLESYKAILTRAGVTDEEVAYVGDDLPDLPILQRVGLGVAVANAVVEVKRAAHYVTVAKGGEGRDPRSRRTDSESAGPLEESYSASTRLSRQRVPRHATVVNADRSKDQLLSSTPSAVPCASDRKYPKPIGRVRALVRLGLQPHRDFPPLHPQHSGAYPQIRRRVGRIGHGFLQGNKFVSALFQLGQKRIETFRVQLHCRESAKLGEFAG